MRGEILFFDERRGSGFINGDDGNRYTFLKSDLRQSARIAKGLRVDFRTEGDRARDIFVADPHPARSPLPSAVPAPPATRDKAPNPLEPRTAPMRVPDIRRGGSDEGLFACFSRCVGGKYLDFRGRARRKEYWTFVLFSFLIYMAVALVGLVADGSLGNLEEEPYLTGALMGLAFLALFLPGLAVTVRRIHDIGLSGWFILLWLVPYAGSLIMIVFALIPSKPADNRWGPPPAEA